MALEVHREIDPNFYIPDGLKNTTTTVTDPETNPSDEVDYDIQNDIEDTTPDEIISDQLPAPSTIQIIQQIVRTGSDGSQLVDIEIEVEDVPGAIDYEIRLTKV